MKTLNSRTETDLISRLGCMRRNTIIESAQWGTIEHVEVWVPAIRQVAATPEGPERTRNPKSAA